jgi:hypothetical protein
MRRSMIREHRGWLGRCTLVGAALLFAACTQGGSSASTSTPTASPSATATATGTVPGTGGGTLARGVYLNRVFQISFHHPLDWSPVNGDAQHLAGADGAATVEAIDSSGEALDQAASAAAADAQHPFGSNPMIEAISVAGVDARLVRPSADAPAQPFVMAAVIFAPPKPIDLDGVNYHLVEVEADAAHIDSIVSSIEFVNNVPTGVQ